MGRILCTLILGMMAPLPTFADDEAMRREVESLKGTWTVASFETQGQAIPKADLDRLQPTWTFKPGGTAVWAGHEREGGEAEYSYRIDLSKAPKTIDFTYVGPSKELKGFKQFGIYKLEEKKMTLCLTQDLKAAEADRPKKFEVDKGVILLTLVRAKE